MISIQDSKVKHLNYVRFISILAVSKLIFFDTSNKNIKIITEILTGMEKVEREVKT